MIRGMVERLAARLEQQPDDKEGWARLAHAYDVLGETDKAERRGPAPQRWARLSRHHRRPAEPERAPTAR